jgi:alpha-D-xyloside xylohydrolase
MCKPLLRMSGWEMAPHTVNGEKTFRVGASFDSPADEHYYGLGQNQEGILDYRGDPAPRSAGSSMSSSL